jgi:hypothetical protein
MVRTGITPIMIQANESLSSYQELYIIDSEGNRHDLTFSHEGDALMGELSLNGYPVGIATLYVRLKDEVDNLSSIYSFAFHIENSKFFTSEMAISTMKNKMDVYTMQNEMDIHSMKNEMVVVTT